MLSDGLRSLLMQATAVTTIIGTPATRTDRRSGVSWVQMVEGADLPALVLSTISGEGTPSLDGADPLHTARIQISCYAGTYAGAKALARAVRNLLEGFAGSLPEGTNVGNVILNAEMDAFEDGPFSFHCPLDFEFWYSEN